MTGAEAKTNSMARGLMRLDARTLLFLIVIANLCVFLCPNLWGEILLMLTLCILGLLCGGGKFIWKVAVAYTLLLGVDLLTSYYGSGGFLGYLGIGCRYLRKVLPTGTLGGILITTVRISELMASLVKLKLPKSVIIPLTVMLRYFPAVREDRIAIKKAMKMRELSGNFFTHPVQSIECLYVPLLMSASRRSDELSCAAVTRGIEKPAQRTTIQDIRLRWPDFVSAGAITAVACFCIWGIVV